jgi:alkanesulfonate monooxygenase SsuD/methylene tetrahydromethanopterin reductase-like flavin-dependent oxidoreductase (luciferase family)
MTTASPAPGTPPSPATRAPGFGVMITKSAAPGADPVAEARHAEALGFDLATVHPDLLHGPEPSLETWTALTWVAARTARIALAPFVLSLPHRHPAVTAKMAETLDRLSGGRLVLGLGAGGALPRAEAAVRAFGLAQRSRGERVAALEEAIDVIRGLWGAPGFTYAGEHFAVAGATITPRPARRIPLWLGAYGPRMLDLTGRKADGWLPSLPVLDPAPAYRALRRIRRAAAAAGRDPDSLTYAYAVPVLVREGATAGQGVVAGGPGEVATALAAFVRHGFSFLIFWPEGDAAVQAEQRERLAAEVIPAVRDRLA